MSKQHVELMSQFSSRSLCGASTPDFHPVLAHRAASSRRLTSYSWQSAASYLMTKVLSGQIYHKLLQVSTTGDLEFSQNFTARFKATGDQMNGTPAAWRGFTVCRLSGKKYKKRKETKENRDVKKKQTNPTWSRASWLRWWRWVTCKKAVNSVAFLGPSDALGSVWCGAVPLRYQSAAAVCWLQHVLHSGSLRQPLLWSSPFTQP